MLELPFGKKYWPRSRESSHMNTRHYCFVFCSSPTPVLQSFLSWQPLGLFWLMRMVTPQYLATVLSSQKQHPDMSDYISSPLPYTFNLYHSHFLTGIESMPPTPTVTMCWNLARKSCKGTINKYPIYVVKHGIDANSENFTPRKPTEICSVRQQKLDYKAPWTSASTYHCNCLYTEEK